MLVASLFVIKFLFYQCLNYLQCEACTQKFLDDLTISSLLLDFGPKEIYYYCNVCFQWIEFLIQLLHTAYYITGSCRSGLSWSSSNKRGQLGHCC